MWNYVSYALSACSFTYGLFCLLSDAHAGRPIDLLGHLLAFTSFIAMLRPPRRSLDG